MRKNQVQHLFTVINLSISLLLHTLCVGADVASARSKLLQEEAHIALGGNIILTEAEESVNTCIMEHKFRELDYSFDNPQYFNFSKHFFEYKDHIEESKVYKVIKDMPKGAALHVHDMGILGPDYLLNVTYRENLFICLDREGVKFKFSEDKPDEPCNDVFHQAGWQNLSEVRNKSSNVTEIDAILRKSFTLVVGDPDKAYPSISDSWKAFMKYFRTVQPLLTYRPVWEQYFYDVLTAFREQNVLYVEVRSILPRLYELHDTTYDELVTVKAYQKATKKFVSKHSDFIGAKLIYAPPRKVDRDTLTTYLNLAKRIKQEMPEFFAGFDLVGQEDEGNPLILFEEQLNDVTNIDFFFHAGETDWYGFLTDENLVDAILLGAKRIGHAYALPKHPLLVKEVLRRNIGLEVNVISNTVLSLVRDVRNHPLSTFVAQGLPVVLSSDDPGAWEADPISYDFYVAFVGAASRLSDLKLLKALAINSLKYSALTETERSAAKFKFDKQWNEFIKNFKCP